jgi:hypothetical protein
MCLLAYTTGSWFDDVTLYTNELFGDNMQDMPKPVSSVLCPVLLRQVNAQKRCFVIDMISGPLLRMADQP